MNRKINNQQNKMISPKLRLWMGIIGFLASLSSISIIEIFFTGIQAVTLFSSGLMLLACLNILVTHEHYKKQYAKMYSYQRLARPVDHEGKEIENNQYNEYLSSSDSQPIYERSEIDKIFAYLMGLMFLTVIGYGITKLGNIKFEDFLYVLPFIAALFYFVIFFTVYRIVMGKKNETRTRKQRIVFLIDVVALLTLFIVFTLNFSPNYMVCILTSGFTFLFSIIMIALTL